MEHPIRYKQAPNPPALHNLRDKNYRCDLIVRLEQYRLENHLSFPQLSKLIVDRAGPPAIGELTLARIVRKHSVSTLNAFRIERFLRSVADAA